MSTASTQGARSHARSQAAAADLRVPAAPAGVAPVWAESVPAGSYTSRVLGRGTRLRLADPDGGACAHLLMFRADAPWERLNVADTVKVPWQAYLGAGHPLLSDQGRVLATVVADTSGHHDTLCGMTPAGQQAMLLAVHPAVAGVKLRLDKPEALRGRAGADAVSLLAALERCRDVGGIVVEDPRQQWPGWASRERSR